MPDHRPTPPPHRQRLRSRFLSKLCVILTSVHAFRGAGCRLPTIQALSTTKHCASSQGTKNHLPAVSLTTTASGEDRVRPRRTCFYGVYHHLVNPSAPRITIYRPPESKHPNQRLPRLPSFLQHKLMRQPHRKSDVLSMLAMAATAVKSQEQKQRQERARWQEHQSAPRRTPGNLRRSHGKKRWKEQPGSRPIPRPASR